jgi:hypothetical protein
MRELTLHIDRIVLDGVPLAASDHKLLRETIQAELSRLIEMRGLDALQSGAVAKLGAPAITASPNATSLGAQIASSIYAGMGAGRR